MNRVVAKRMEWRNDYETYKVIGRSGRQWKKIWKTKTAKQGIRVNFHEDSFRFGKRECIKYFNTKFLGNIKGKISILWAKYYRTRIKILSRDKNTFDTDILS